MNEPHLECLLASPNDGADHPTENKALLLTVSSPIRPVRDGGGYWCTVVQRQQNTSPHPLAKARKLRKDSQTGIRMWRSATID